MIADVVIQSSPARVPQLKLNSQLPQLVESSLNFVHDCRGEQKRISSNFICIKKFICGVLYKLSYMIAGGKSITILL